VNTFFFLLKQSPGIVWPVALGRCVLSAHRSSGIRVRAVSRLLSTPAATHPDTLPYWSAVSIHLSLSLAALFTLCGFMVGLAFCFCLIASVFSPLLLFLSVETLHLLCGVLVSNSAFVLAAVQLYR
jgi:hypothetical protein